MRAMQPRARNCASIHSARFCSKNVGAGMRQSCKCCSLIHFFSRANHCRASRMGVELAHSARNFEMGGWAEGAEASLIGAAKCQFSSGWLLVGSETLSALFYILPARNRKRPSRAELRQGAPVFLKFGYAVVEWDFMLSRVFHESFNGRVAQFGGA